MKYLIYLLLFVTLDLHSYSQKDNTSLKPLEIGDRVPDVEITNITNYVNSKANVSNFKGKLLILDFWTKNCSACIASFPEMQKLQEEFKDRIQILLVTYQSQNELRSLFARSPILKNIALPFVWQDKKLHTLFPHVTVPHHVWIDTNGVIMAITEKSNTNEQSIQDYFVGKKYHFNKKAELMSDFDFNQSLLTEGNGRQIKNFNYYSVLMKGISLGNDVIGWLTDSVTLKQIGIHAINEPILNMYGWAYGWNLYDRNSIWADMKDPISFFGPDDDEKALQDWADTSRYCYELRVPEDQLPNINAIMQKDLDRLFHLKSHVEIKWTKCLVLKRLSDVINIRSKGGQPINDQTDTAKIMLNIPFNTFVDDIKAANFKIGGLPIINATGLGSGPFDDKIDLVIHSKLNDIAALQKELTAYGLSLIEEVRPIPILIIQED